MRSTPARSPRAGAGTRWERGRRRRACPPHSYAPALPGEGELTLYQTEYSPGSLVVCAPRVQQQIACRLSWRFYHSRSGDIGFRSDALRHQPVPLVRGDAMPKQVKGNAWRKPPEPSANHSDIDDWFRRQMPHLQPIVQALDESIRATIPGLHYAVKWKRPYYGLPERGWIIELAAYDVSVNVVFLGGADFDSPPPLGTTDRTRYIKVTTLEEAQRPELHTWIEEASRTPGWN